MSDRDPKKDPQKGDELKLDDGSVSLLVQRVMCSTCIYRPDSPLNLAALENQVADPQMEGFFSGYRQCHHSDSACCAGFWKLHKDDFTLGQIAQRLNAVELVDHDTISGRGR